MMAAVVFLNTVPNTMLMCFIAKALLARLKILTLNMANTPMTKDTKQSRYAKRVVRVPLAINPATEADIFASLNALAAVHGGNAQAIKYLLRNAAK